MSTPAVSIIMSVYNSESTLLDALDSIVQQTFDDWELIVCDDASTDATAALLHSFVVAHPAHRIVLLSNKVNRKLAYSLNRCLEASSGALIARMDGDDVSEPERLERQVSFLNDHPEVDLVGTSMRRFNSRGLGEIIGPAALAPDRGLLGRTAWVPFCHATIVARRSVFAAVGNYTVSWRTRRAEDLDLWFKFFAADLVGRNLPEPLYRVREDEAAVRRRTASTRLGVVFTRIRGNWSLKYPVNAYVVPALELAKILVPFRIILWHRRRAERHARGNSISPPS